MSETKQALVSIKRCSRYEQKFIFLLRALVAGQAWRSQAIHELEGLGISAEDGFLFLHLMETLETIEPKVKIQGPKATFITVDELNLLTLLRRATSRVETSAESSFKEDLGFDMPLAVAEILPLCGEALRRSTMRFSPRPFLLSGANVASVDTRKNATPVINARELRSCTVISNDLLKTGMRRICLSGAALAGIQDQPPGQWVKVFPLPTDAGKGAEDTPSTPSGRVYTVRKFDAELNLLTIDVAIHGGGVVSSALEALQPGDLCQVAGSRGGFEGMPSDCKEVVFAGDETALPAIASILEMLPDDLRATAFIQVENESCVQSLMHSDCAEVHWIFRNAQAGASRNIKNEMLAWCAQRSSFYVWAAGEHDDMRDLRRTLLGPLKLDARCVHTVGYWKRGHQDHRDASAG